MDRDSQPAGSLRTIPGLPRARLGGGESRRRRRRKSHPPAGGRRSRHPAVSPQPRRSACPFSLWRSTGRRRRMTIENRDVKAGTRLMARYKGQEHSADVVETEAGIRYRLASGKEYKSPSAAGSAIMGGNACNGWRFWSLVNGVATPAKPKKESKRSGPKHANGKGLIRKMDDGRYFCSSCMDAFEAPAGVDPIVCPQGHSLEQMTQFVSAEYQA